MDQVGAGPAEAGIRSLLALTPGSFTGVARRVGPPQPESTRIAAAMAPIVRPTRRPVRSLGTATGPSTPVTIPRIGATMPLWIAECRG